jgi:AraC-like DNA-binding protein
MKNKLSIKIKTLIDEDPAKEHSLQQLALQFHVSKATLMQQFKTMYNTSIHQYVLQQRLQQAALLLKETDDKISVIAHSCGFNSEKHFMTLFKRHFSMSPGVYRRLNSTI